MRPVSHLIGLFKMAFDRSWHPRGRRLVAPTLAPSMVVGDLGSSPAVHAVRRPCAPRGIPPLGSELHVLGEGARTHPWRRWWRITLPLMRRPTIAAGAMILAVSLGEFGSSWVLLQSSGQRTLPLLIDAQYARAPSIQSFDHRCRWRHGAHPHHRDALPSHRTTSRPQRYGRVLNAPMRWPRSGSGRTSDLERATAWR